MKIIEITTNNFDLFKLDLIDLNDRFLKDLGIEKERTQAQKEHILKKMISPHSPTQLLIVVDKQEKALGMTYFNVGTGYSCGGDYLWLNSIYIRPAAQAKGYGSALLTYIEKWAKERQFTLILSSRDLDNEASRKLFERQGFEQSENIWISKVLS